MVRLENVLKISLQDILKVSWRHLEDVFRTSWRRLEDVLKTPWRGLEDVLKTSWRRLENVLKKSWKRLEDVLKTYGQDEYIGLDQDILKTSSEEVRLRRTYSSWRGLLKTKTRDAFKTSSKRFHQDQCLLGCEFEVLFVCDLIWTPFLSYLSKKIFAAFVEVTLWDWYYCFQWLNRFTYLCSFSFSSLLLKGGL